MKTIDMSHDPRAKRRTWVLLGGLLLLVLSAIWSIFSGVVNIPWSEASRVVDGTMPEELQQIVYNIRIPRMITGALVGMNLALAGAIMQGVLRNPLADPGILGVSAGAGLGAMFILILAPHLMGYVPLVAFVGAMIALAAVYLLAWQRNRIEPMRLILAGVALSALFGGVMTALMVFHSDKVQGSVQWMAGGFQGRSWAHVRMVLPYTIAGLIGAIWSSRSLNILALGDEVATSLGMRVQHTRIILMTLAGLLTASAVSAAGLLGFVGLMIPHIARLLVGSDFEVLMPTAAILGATLVVGADTFARLIFQPIEVPVGVFMAFLGAPFFLYLLRRGRPE